MIIAAPLTPAAFAPFGQVIGGGGGGRSANQGTAMRTDDVAELVSTRPGAHGNLATFRVRAASMPFTVRLLERHPLSSQLFVPLRVDRYLVVVAPSDPEGSPLLSGLTAFMASQGQAINYDPGVWHHPLIALGSDAEFLMLAWEDGSAADTELCALPAELVVADAR